MAVELDKRHSPPQLGEHMTEPPFTCPQVAARLSDYVEGDLDDRDRRLLEAHLADCGTCRQTLDELRLTISLLRKLPPLESRSTGTSNTPGRKNS
jgi:anti-sigma factor RsiW